MTFYENLNNMSECLRFTFLPPLLLGILTFPTFAQPRDPATDSRPRLEFERIGLAEGLPNEYVNCITQDKFGFMWFGTKEGLCRYDGQKFKTYKLIPDDSTSLLGNEILVLFADSKGTLWVGANGLQQFNFDRDNFTRIAPPAYAAIANKLQYISKVCEDNSGNLWLGTYGKGLFKFNPASGQLAQIELGDHGPKLSVIHSLFANGSDTIWVTSNNRQVTVLNTRTGQQKYYFLPHQGDLQKTFLDRVGRLWLGAIGEPLKQMYLQANDQITFRRFEKIKPANFFTDFQDDRNGNLWIGTQLDGIYALNPSRNEIQNYRHKSREAYSLAGDQVLEIYEDRSGNMWMATNKGVCKWARWKKPFRHFQHDTEQPNSINNAEVTGIDQDANGNLWISTLNAGFCKLNPRTEIFTRYDPSTSGIKSPWGMEILADRNGLIWIATNFQHGLNRFDLATGKFKEYLHNPKDTTSLSSNLVTTFFEDHEGRVWVGAAYKGLNLYEPHSDGFRRFQHNPSDPTSLSHNNVFAICQDKALTLWIGTSNGLNRFDSQQGSFTRYIPVEITTDETQSFEVYAIHEDSRQRFWLGTNLGLYLFDRQDGKFERIAELQGLTDGRIFSILEDGAGNLWLQTIAAIVKFDTQTRKFRVYDWGDGWIQSGIHQQEWQHADEKLNSGELIYGGSNGVTIFHPDSIKDNPYAPAVHITGFNLFYQPVDFRENPEGRRAKGDSLFTRALLLTDHLTLRHSENTFSFEFAALDYTQPEANQYAFMLERFHDDWVHGGNMQTATFTNIPPGDYTFRVKGSNNDDLWNEEGDAIKITILPPWWKTRTAYFAYVLLLGAALFAVWRFEMNRVKMRNELRMREFEAQKLHEVDRMKSRFFANISHEFRTPLTLILGPLEDVIAKVKDKMAKDDLRLMERNARRLLRLINQLLDLSRLESGRMTLHARRGDFIAFLKGIVMSFASLAEQKKITLKFDEASPAANDNGAAFYFDHDKVEKILYNLLSNAFKFTPEGGAVLVRVEIGSVGDSESRGLGDRERKTKFSHSPPHPLSPSYLQVSVRDTGIGIPADRLPYIFDRFYQVDDTHTREHEGSGLGLALTKELVERHYGEIEAHSEEGMGSEFIVRLPIGKEYLKPEEIVEDGEAMIEDRGSRVENQVTGDEQPATSDQHPVTRSSFSWWTTIPTCAVTFGSIWNRIITSSKRKMAGKELIARSNPFPISSSATS